MFGAKYSRQKFWIILLLLLIPLVVLRMMETLAEAKEDANLMFIIAIGYFVIAGVQLNTLANRIRDYGSNPWLSLLALIPLVNLVVTFYYGIVQYKNKPVDSNTSIHNSPSLSKAVYNHTKDIASEIKPTINEYKEKHQTSKTDTSNISSIDEDAIYEKVMLEIEENNKVKSTWAKALAQSEGVKDRAESLYINFRVQNIKNEVEKILEIKEEQEQKNKLKTLGGKPLTQKEKAFLEKYSVNEFSSLVTFSENEICIDHNTGLKRYIR